MPTIPWWHMALDLGNSFFLGWYIWRSIKWKKHALLARARYHSVLSLVCSMCGDDAARLDRALAKHASEIGMPWPPGPKN